MQPRSSSISAKCVRFLNPIDIPPTRFSSVPLSTCPKASYVPLLESPRRMTTSGFSHKATICVSGTHRKSTPSQSENKKPRYGEALRGSTRLSHSLKNLLFRKPRIHRPNPPGNVLLSTTSPGVHFLLHHFNTPGIYYDAREPASTIWTRYHSLPQDAFYNPATNPPVSQLTLTSPFLQRRIHIASTDHDNRNGQLFISVNNILETIYYAFHQIIYMDEYESFGRTFGVGAQVKSVKAYEDRIRRIKDARVREAEKLKGMRRVDFLQGRTRFLGLTASADPSRNNEWVIEFE